MTEHEIIITNGTKKALTNLVCLFNTYYADSMIQVILTEEEVAASGIYPSMEITKVSLMPASTLPSINLTEFRIKMGQTDRDTIEFNTFMTDLQLVYGPYTIPYANLRSDTWYDLVLDKPYKYRGGSLAIEISRDLGTLTGSTGSFYVYGVTQNALRGVIAGGRSLRFTYDQYYTSLLDYAETIDYVPAFKFTAQPFEDIVQTQDIRVTTSCMDIKAASGVSAIQENFINGLPDYFIFDRPGYRVSNEFAYLGMPTVLAFRKINECDRATVQLFLYYTTTGTFSFKRKMYTEANYDLYKFLIDGVEKVSTSGNIDWTTESYTVVPGLHEFKWVTTSDEYMCQTRIWLANITAVGADSSRAGMQQIKVKTDCLDEHHYTGKEYYDIYLDPDNPFNTTYYPIPSSPAGEVSVVDVTDWKFGTTRAFKIKQTDLYDDCEVYFNIPIEMLGPGKFSCYVQMNCYWYSTNVNFILEEPRGTWDYVVEMDAWSMAGDLLDIGEVPDHKKWFRVEFDIPAGLQQIIIWPCMWAAEGYSEDDGAIYLADIHIFNANPDVYRTVILTENWRVSPTDIYTTPYRNQVIKAVTNRVTGYETYTTVTRPQVTLVKTGVIVGSETYYTPQYDINILTPNGIVPNSELQFKVINYQWIKPVVRASSVFTTTVPALPSMGITLDNINPATPGATSLSTTPGFRFGNFVTCLDGSVLVCFRVGLEIKLSKVESEEQLFTIPNIVEQNAWTVYTLSTLQNENYWMDYPEYCYLQVLNNKEILLYIIDITQTAWESQGATFDLFRVDFYAYVSLDGLGDKFTLRSKMATLQELSSMWGPYGSGVMFTNPIKLNNGRIGIVSNYYQTQILLGESRIWFHYSDDDGHSWQHVLLPRDGIRETNTVGLSHTEDVVMTIPRLNTIGDTARVCFVSYDNGITWSQHPGRLSEYDIFSTFDGNGDGYSYMLNGGTIYYHRIDIPPYMINSYNEYGIGKYWEPLIDVSKIISPFKLLVSPDTFNIAVCNTNQIYAFNRNILGKLAEVKEIYVITESGLRRVLEAYVITATGLKPIPHTDIIIPK